MKPELASPSHPRLGRCPRLFTRSDVLRQFAKESVNPSDSVCPHPPHLPEPPAACWVLGRRDCWCSWDPALVLGTHIAPMSRHSVRPTIHPLMQGQHGQ